MKFFILFSLVEFSDLLYRISRSSWLSWEDHLHYQYKASLSNPQNLHIAKDLTTCLSLEKLGLISSNLKQVEFIIIILFFGMSLEAHSMFLIQF